MKQASRCNALMRELCVGPGWCGGVIDGEPGHVDVHTPETGPVTAGQGVDGLPEAEGFTALTHPAEDGKWRARLIPVFVRQMGADTVDAAELQWDAP